LRNSGSFPALGLSGDNHRLCASSDDAFDALVARAAVFRLTDPPSPPRREQAAQEGWIHLRGSLPFISHDEPALAAQPAPALAAALTKTGVAVTRDGYASCSTMPF